MKRTDESSALRNTELKATWSETVVDRLIEVDISQL